MDFAVGSPISNMAVVLALLINRAVNRAVEVFLYICFYKWLNSIGYA